MNPIAVKEHLPEVCIVEVPSIVLVIETGLGYYTYPMLVIETKMNAEVRDWSSEVNECRPQRNRIRNVSSSNSILDIHWKFDDTGNGLL